MLVELHIKNLALIESLNIEFDSAANVLTGETGAGKSILVGAIGLLMGDKASSDLIRKGEEEAVIEGFFILDDLDSFTDIFQEINIEATEEIIIRRVINSRGRSKAYLNGSMLTIAQLNLIGAELLAISGQHDQQSLLKSSAQLNFLDQFAKHKDTLMEMKEAWQKQEILKNKLLSLENEIREIVEKRDFYEFQLAEINKVKPKKNEDDELFFKKNSFKNNADLSEALNFVSQTLAYEPNNILSKLDKAKRKLASFEDLKVTKVFDLLEDANDLLMDASSEVDFLNQEEETDDFDVEAIDERLNELAKIKRKYGPSLDDVINFAEEITEILNKSDLLGLDLKQIRREYNEAYLKAKEIALKLYEKRLKASENLSNKLVDSLKPLGFPNLNLEIEIKNIFKENINKTTTKNDFELITYKGADSVNILFSPNPGEGIKPLSKIASGGELSRFMLALKTAPELSSDQSLIFDEIDTGLGGETVGAVAEKMAKLSKKQQVFIITHTAQMAALKGKHFFVSKDPQSIPGRTITTITELTNAEREKELSRMLGGANPSLEAKALAKHLLEINK